MTASRRAPPHEDTLRSVEPVQGLNRLDLTPTPLPKEGLSLTEKHPGVGDHAPHPE